MSDGVLAGRRALVTGGGSGIGRATCRLAAAAGARIAVLDVDADSAHEVAGECGGEAIVADVRDTAAVEAAVGKTIAVFGGIDAVVANAGVGNVMPLHRYQDDEFERIVGVNLRGVFTVLRAALPKMVAGGGGSAVTMASVAGVRATRGESPYAAAKAGVVALTQSAALEYAPSVRVNCVSPGFIATPLTRLATENDQMRARIEAATPLGRLGEPDDVARVIVFLLSDAAGYITGQNLIIDGGSVLPSGQADPLLRGVLALYS